jgi:hypothetical protein
MQSSAQSSYLCYFIFDVPRQNYGNILVRDFNVPIIIDIILFIVRPFSITLNHGPKMSQYQLTFLLVGSMTDRVKSNSGNKFDIFDRQTL